MHQPILGAAIPLSFALAFYLCRRCRAPLWLLIATPLAMVLGAIWAVMPDIPRLIGWQSLYATLASDPRSNIFFWHYSIDQIEAAHLDAMTPLFNTAFALLVAALLAAAWGELRRAEQWWP
jgi:hypothetical protein